MATLVGFVLGIHVPLTRLLGVGHAERTADLIQAHGQVQLLGFAGLFALGVSLRLLPRFASARLAFAGLAPFVLWLIVTGLILRAILMPWFYGDLHDALLIASSFCLLLGSSCFLFLVAATVVDEARRPDASSLAFMLGAMLLFAATLVATWAAIDAVSHGERDIPYLADNAIVQLELLGFLLVFITGVALRALPVVVGVERPGRGARLLPVGLSGSAGLLAASLLYLQYVSFSTVIARLADLGFIMTGLVLLGLVWQAGVLRAATNRLRPASRPQLWLIRSAFVWLVVASVVAVYAGLKAFSKAELPSQYEFDAVRHALGVGVVTNLILGMSLMILPEFAVQRQRPNLQRRLAILLAGLIDLAAALRVAPALAGDGWSYDQRNLWMAVAGSLAETGMVIFAVYLLRLIWQTRRRTAA